MTKESKKSILAIIPARSGSKRLKNKNMLCLGNKPLVQWSIDEAKKSKYINKLVVNSDDVNIKDLCQKLNVEFINRPVELAQDTSSTIDVIIHTIEFFKNKNEYFEYILILQPTSPFRTSRHIDEACETLFTKHADGIISIRESEDHPLWSKNINSDLDMSNFINKKHLNKRKQDLPTFYTLNGAIYLAKSSKLIKEKTVFFENNIFGYLMTRKESIDIDTELDFKFAQYLINS